MSLRPDLLWIAEDQLDNIREKHVRGEPALVVEILSPGTRRVDERTKRGLYDRVGVRECWIVDPDGKRVAVFARSDGQLERSRELSADLHDTLTVMGRELPSRGRAGLRRRVSGRRSGGIRGPT